MSTVISFNNRCGVKESMPATPITSLLSSLLSSSPSKEETVIMLSVVLIGTAGVITRGIGCIGCIARSTVLHPILPLRYCLLIASTCYWSDD